MFYSFNKFFKSPQWANFLKFKDIFFYQIIKKFFNNYKEEKKFIFFNIFYIFFT